MESSPNMAKVHARLEQLRAAKVFGEVTIKLQAGEPVGELKLTTTEKVADIDLVDETHRSAR